MFLRGARFVAVGLILVLTVNATQAQEVPPGAEPPGGSEKDAGPYAPLAKSKDRSTQLMVDRYEKLVRLQEWEWSKTSGKIKVSARYVAHDPNLQWVKLAAVTGSGKTRVVKEGNVDFSKLSKTCQTRVKQIDLLQKKLDELMAKEPGQPGQPGATSPGDPGAPMTDERGVEPGASIPGPYDQPPGGALPPGTPAPDSADTAPGADQEDPLGFAEVPEGAGAGCCGRGPGHTKWSGVPASSRASRWQRRPDKMEDELRCLPRGFRPDPSPEPQPDWGSLTVLKEAADEVKKWEATGNVGAKEHAEIDKKFAAVGEFTWEATLAEADAAGGDWTKRLNLPPLPPPFSIGFTLDSKHNPGNWQTLKTGERVRFIGRFVDIEHGTAIVAAIRFPEQR